MRKTHLALTLGIILFPAAALFAADHPQKPLPEFLQEEFRQTPPITAAFQSPAPVTLACGPYCDCPGCYSTSLVTVSSTSCANAQAGLDFQLRGIAFCSPCQFTIIYTLNCTQTIPGTYLVKGYAKHGCRDSTC